MTPIDQCVERAQQVVIIGAPRSGTNMLRDVICSVDGVATWPCDEINYIWRHGNIRYPSDAFTAEMATAPIRSYIQKQFDWVSRRYQAHTVIEKTCANSLRVGFVERILDEPKFVFIHRNGVDAVASAMSRWRGNLDLIYVFKKARFVPFNDLPYHAFRYLQNRVNRLWSSERRLSIWGPVLPQMEMLKAHYSLAEVCSLQWRSCVERSLEAFEQVPEHRLLRVCYEELVSDKEEQISRIGKFLGLNHDELISSWRFEQICAGSIGKGYRAMPRNVVSKVEGIVRPTMERLGYQ